MRKESDKDEKMGLQRDGKSIAQKDDMFCIGKEDLSYLIEGASESIEQILSDRG